MTMRGSYQNRVQENKMYTDKIKVGTGVTEYLYTDRRAYEVIEVINQKHVVIREYDHKHKGENDGWASNNWELISNENNPTCELVRRGNYWYGVATVTKEDWENADNNEKLRIVVGGFDPEKIMEKGKQTKYYRHNVSFGVADYYYDYEF